MPDSDRTATAPFPRVAVILASYPPTIHLVNLVRLFGSNGFDIDVFLVNATSYNFIDLDALRQIPNVHVFECSNHKTGEKNVNPNPSFILKLLNDSTKILKGIGGELTRVVRRRCGLNFLMQPVD